MEPSIAIVQGSSRGLGLELVRQLLARGERVVATCRDPDAGSELRETGARVLRVDVEDEPSIAAAADALAGERAHLLMNVAGLLHDGEDLQPEKKLADVDPAALARLFAVNATGPLLVAKHLAPLLLHGRRAVLANVSARVGSIADNRLGGWYGYRASKAAQNMVTRTLAIELGRKSEALVAVALHPGTVDTDLSAPFSRRVPPERLFSTQRAAAQLLTVVDAVLPSETGSFFAWDGSAIPW